jgi:hypothetical protein
MPRLTISQKNYLRGMYRRYRRAWPNKGEVRAKAYALNGFRNWLKNLANQELTEELRQEALRFLDSVMLTE